jgi:hypothetical protein
MMNPTNTLGGIEYVHDTEQDAPDAAFDGRQLDLYARSKGYFSFAEYAAYCFRRGEWLLGTIEPPTFGYFADGKLYPTRKEASRAGYSASELQKMSTCRVNIQTRLDESRAVRMIWNRLSQDDT